MLTGRFQRLTWIAGLTCFLLVVGVAGSAAAVRREASNGSVLLRGMEVGGVPIDGLNFNAAQKLLTDRFEKPLDRSIQVTMDGQFLVSTTQRQLGASTNVQEVHRKALELHSSMPPLKRLWYRITGMTVGSNLQVKTQAEDKVAADFIAGIAKKVNRAPQDASVALVGGTPRFKEETPGFALDEQAAREAVKQALASPDKPVNLTGVAVAPAVTRESFKDVIVVKVGENKLYHYQGASLRKTYNVATGLPRYPTPVGNFEITQKRFRPTWVNPAKSKGKWGENLPASIGPGPGNPLGTRAMNLNSPGIRIHGTSTEASLGFNASHGCIRMNMSDVEELFELVGVGTPVLIVQSGPNRVYQPTAAPTLEQLVESNGAAAQDVPAVVEPAPLPIAPAPVTPLPEIPAPVAEPPVVTPPGAQPSGSEPGTPPVGGPKGLNVSDPE